MPTTALAELRLHEAQAVLELATLLTAHTLVLGLRDDAVTQPAHLLLGVGLAKVGISHGLYVLVVHSRRQRDVTVGTLGVAGRTLAVVHR